MLASFFEQFRINLFLYFLTTHKPPPCINLSNSFAQFSYQPCNTTNNFLKTLARRNARKRSAAPGSAGELACRIPKHNSSLILASFKFRQNSDHNSLPPSHNPPPAPPLIPPGRPQIIIYFVFDLQKSKFCDFGRLLADPKTRQKSASFQNLQNHCINRPLDAQVSFLDEKTSAAPRRGGERVKLNVQRLANASF